MHPYLLIGLLAAALLESFGCSTPAPILEKWVTDRGYIYYRDYSTINPLGRVVHSEGHLVESSWLAVTDAIPGGVTDFSATTTGHITIKGRAEVEHLLKHLVDPHVEGAFETIASAELTLVGPYKLEATRFSPRGRCDNSEITVVTKVLNTGEFSLRVLDSRGGNITANFGFKGGNVTVGTSAGATERINVKGNGFIGYFPESFRCKVLSMNPKFIIKRGEHAEIAGVDFLYKDFVPPPDKETRSLPAGTVYIVPSEFLVQTGKLIDFARASHELAKQSATIAVEDLIRPLESKVYQQSTKAEQVEYLLAKINTLESDSKRSDAIFSTRFDLPKQSQEELFNSYSPWNLRTMSLKKKVSKASGEPEALQLLAQEAEQIAQGKALALAKATTGEPIVITKAEWISLTFGSHVTIPAQRPTAGVYLEVVEVNKDSMTGRMMNIEFERVKP